MNTALSFISTQVGHIVKQAFVQTYGIHFFAMLFQLSDKMQMYLLVIQYSVSFMCRQDRVPAYNKPCQKWGFCVDIDGV